MTDALEAAASAVRDYGYSIDERQPEIVDDDRETARLVIVAWLRAAIGCPQCGGTGRRWKSQQHGWSGSVTTGPCPAEHVEITLFGETIYADPAKCLWWCTRSEVGYAPLDRNDDDTGCRIDDPLHADCGWQPRIDALFHSNNLRVEEEQH